MSLIDIISGEFLLRRYANGGKVIFFRSVWLSALLFIGGLGLRDLIDPTRALQFDLHRLRVVATEQFAWFGAILAFAYVGFYARFSSQWAYLQSVYNSFMETEATIDPNNKHAWRTLYCWQAGFIEDADTLHLARKPIFARLIQNLLADKDVREQFEIGTSGGKERLARLELQISAVVQAEERKYKPGNTLNVAVGIYGAIALLAALYMSLYTAWEVFKVFGVADDGFWSSVWTSRRALMLGGWVVAPYSYVLYLRKHSPKIWKSSSYDWQHAALATGFILLAVYGYLCLQNDVLPFDRTQPTLYFLVLPVGQIVICAFTRMAWEIAGGQLPRKRRRETKVPPA